MTQLVIDADGHVAEPIDLFEKYADLPLGDRLPRVVQDDRGFDRWVIEGRLYPTPEGKGVGPKLRYGVFREGMLNPIERLKDMELEGIHTAVIFPSVAMRFGWGIENPDFAVLACRTYNNFILDYCSASPARLKGVAALPLQNPSAAAEELRRCISKGMVGGCLSPHFRGIGLEKEVYDPIYRAAEEISVPVLIHASNGTDLSPAAGVERYDKFFFVHIVCHPFEQMLAMLSLIGGGVLERFPRLRVGFFESGAGYLPYWLERIDEHFEDFPKDSTIMKMSATEYFRRQCFISCEPEEKELRHTIDVIGAERILFASDYHHFDAKFPHTVSALAERNDLTDQEKQKIFCGNAEALFRFKKT